MLASIKRGIKEMLHDNDGYISSKRVITIIAVLLLIVITISNLYWAYSIEPFIFESIMWIVMAGLGTATLEKFATAWKERGTPNND